MSAILIFLVRLAVIAQRRPSVTGAAGMIGAPATALTEIPAGGSGRVSARGEIWSARAFEAVAAGDPLLVSGIDGLVLTVRRRPAPEGHP
jgi:membrane-bound ClpP family serine protease